jgi:hypothetical protein
MKAIVIRNGKSETYKITHFELINRSSKYITMFPDKVLATTKDIISIDIKDLQEVNIREGE